MNMVENVPVIKGEIKKLNDLDCFALKLQTMYGVSKTSETLTRRRLIKAVFLSTLGLFDCVPYVNRECLMANNLTREEADQVLVDLNIYPKEYQEYHVSLEKKKQ